MSNLFLGEMPVMAGLRDATHVAMIAVEAKAKLFPGQDVGKGGTVDDPVGIVDPFVKRPIQPGETFWLCLYPKTTTGMRHHWEHPDFDNVEQQKSSKDISDAWLRDFIARNHLPSYEVLIAAACDHGISHLEEGCYSNIDDEYLYFNGVDAHGEIPDEFWVHIENVTGEKCIQRPKYFSCGC